MVNLDNISLRKAHADDVGIYFEWVNDREVRKQSFNSEAIAWETHKEWYKNRLLDDNCITYVMESDGQPVGPIRFDITDGVAAIDYSLDKQLRGKHLGQRLVNEAINLGLKKRNVIFQASVKKQNIASIKTFMKLGFEEVNSDDPEICVFHKKSL